MEDSSTNVKVHGGSFISRSSVKGDVTSTVRDISVSIEKLPGSSDPEQPGIKEILEKLKTAIETEPDLDEKNKIKALKQVEEIAKAAQSSNDGEEKEKADNAITMLKGIFSGLQTGATLLEAWNNILPLLSKLFGIG
ncbi:hypothetical protein [Microseira wollei]|uniref:Pentapeptide repeat-containing protein n=1 Tax=Microseira wollei NIES-4236 TaxID=2530354 RepID=A0AAV3XNW2_9CYAN|nr:hypothetical protein [Microseira wollei]GET43580.1 pentapeptide repeat-containing protein [Microseira wollei NIES-4236]